MPAATMQRSPHLQELEKGLRTLKSSKLRAKQEFETMYGVIERHHRDLKLGYLTGMPTDRRKQAEQDCKFYFILAKMMGEIDCGGAAEKQVGLSQVYNWFEQHRSDLNTGPRFGRAKRRSAGSARPSTAGASSSASSTATECRQTRPGSSLSQGPRPASRDSQVSSAKTRRTNDPPRQPSLAQVSSEAPEVPHAPSPPTSEVSVAAEYYFRQYGEGHIEDVGLPAQNQPNVTPDPVTSDPQRPHSAPTQHEHRPQAPTPDVAMRGRGGRPDTAASESVLLPRRKPLPLPHVFNPLSKAFEATIEQLPASGPPSDRSAATARIQLSSRENTPRDPAAKPASTDRERVYEDATGGSVYQDQAGGVISLRMSHLQKWGNYQHNQSVGQDTLAKLQHVGRAGVPGSTRYAAHEHGLTTEDMTQHVIANYALQDEHRRLQNGTTPIADARALVERPLEEFYESTEPYYPVKRNKYPSFRGKSAPLGGKAARQAVDKESTVSGAGSVDSESGPDSALRLDSLVTMIDTVTDEMTTHKEKVAPEPLAGFRQPTVSVDLTARPQTAPPGERARPATPDDRDARSESHMYNQVAPGREQLLLRPSTEGAAVRAAPESFRSAFEMLDWRGKVTPDTARSRWSQSFGSHSFVQKMARPRSSLRSSSAGGAASPWRPKTSSSVTPVEEQLVEEPPQYPADHRRPAVAASHTTTEVDAEVVSALLTTTKFNSGSVRTRPQFEEDVEFDESFMREFGRRVTSERQATPPSKEYVTFCTSMRATQDMRLGSKDKEMEQQSRSQVHTADTVASQVPRSAPAQVSAPVMTDTSKFLQEVHRLVASGALEEDEGYQNTARSDGPAGATLSSSAAAAEGASGPAEGATGDPAQEAALEEEEAPTRKRLTFCLEEGAGQVAVPGEEEEEEEAERPGRASEKADFGLDEFDEAVMNVNVDECVRNLAPGRYAAGTASEKLSAGYKHRIFQHAFPTTPRGATSASASGTAEETGTGIAESLSIEGRGARTADKRKSGSLSAEDREKMAGGGRREAGKAPARARSANPMRVLQKQSEMLKKSPVGPYRTPPSIPGPWGEFGTRTRKKPTPPPPAPPHAPPAAPVFMSELEAQSRRMKSPRHYMEKVTELRRPAVESDDHVPRLPPSSEMTEEERQLVEPLKVFRMKHEDGTPFTISCAPPRDRARTAPGHSGHSGHSGEAEGHRSEHEGAPPCAACVEENSHQGPYMGQRLLDMGRPIPQYLPAADPVEVAAAAQRLREAQAAVDIQRIFRGFVARNQYKYLMTEERQRREDQQKAAIEIQRRMRGHLARKRAISRRKPERETLVWAKEYSEQLKDRERLRKVKAFEDQERISKKNAESSAKLAIIGPHVDVYEPFHPKKTGPDRQLLNRAATIIQQVARGWLVRLRLERLKRKAKYHASSWTKFMTHYQELLRRVQLRAGYDKPRTPFDFRDISEYMDLKKRYESVFDKRAFGGEMEQEELLAYFKECDLYPAKSEVEDTCATIFRGQVLKKPRGMYKQEVLEVTFQLYPPRGTGIQSTRKSTWLNPIVDGEEAVKLSGTDNVEQTDFRTCWKLVSGTAKVRREQTARAQQEAEDEEDERLEERKKAALKAKSRQEKKPAAPPAPPAPPAPLPEATPTPAVNKGEPPAETEPTPVTSSPAAPIAETKDLEPPAKTEAAIETPPGEKKSFIEEKLERIENEAPEWVPQPPAEPNEEPAEATSLPVSFGDVTNTTLGTIAEGAEGGSSAPLADSPSINTNS